MSRITQRAAVAPISMFSQYTSTSAGTGVVDPSPVTYTGQKFDTSDGRELTLVSVGSTAIASGVVVSGAAPIANHQTLAVSVTTVPATAGTYQVQVTLGATVANQNYYQGGFLVVKDGTGAGQTLRIASNPGAAASATLIVTLEDAIVTTLDATSVVNLLPSPFNNVVIGNHTTLPGNAVGVTFYPLSAATAPTYNGTSGVQTAAGIQQYGLVVNKGITSCLADATVAAVGLGLTLSAATDGAVTLATTTGSQIGRALQTTISAKYGAIYADF